MNWADMLALTAILGLAVFIVYFGLKEVATVSKQRNLYFSAKPIPLAEMPTTYTIHFPSGLCKTVSRDEYIRVWSLTGNEREEFFRNGPASLRPMMVRRCKRKRGVKP